MSSSEAMSEMVEKVARACALALSEHAQCSGPDTCIEGCTCLREGAVVARAAIEAMMEPSKPMVDAGRDELDRTEGVWASPSYVAMTYAAMLRASLTEGE